MELTGVPKPPTITKKEHTTREQDVENRVAGYADWVTGLAIGVQKGEISQYDMATTIGRALAARDLQNERLDERGKRDSLTQLPNRRGFDEKFKKAIESGDTIGLLALDIDFFKKVNDTYGHKVGDRVLIGVANTVAGNLRQLREGNHADIVARMGGEEFAVVVVLSDSDPNHPHTIEQKREDLRGIAEKLRLSLSKHQLSTTVDGKIVPIPVTISIGGSLYYGGDSGDFYHTVDKVGLYEAKNTGRNKTVIIEATPDSLIKEK